MVKNNQTTKKVANQEESEEVPQVGPDGDVQQQSQAKAKDKLQPSKKKSKQECSGLIFPVQRIKKYLKSGS